MILADPCEACAASATYGGITSRQHRSECTQQRLGPSSSCSKTARASSTSSALSRWTEVHSPTSVASMVPSGDDAAHLEVVDRYRVPRLVLDVHDLAIVRGEPDAESLAVTANSSTVWSTALAVTAVATLLPSESTTVLLRSKERVASYASLPGGLLVNQGIGSQLDIASGDGAWGCTGRRSPYMRQYTCCGHSLRLLPESFVSYSIVNAHSSW
ncbi:uncharacterized protein SCHCODRAFT_02327474 [Schizophyllum commune H4-8]|nr:uncharacterized protein SCHCODRAFT_02327474 [Schizophyllum commune H4-8]KAI5891730.1 hypothetical protein SCHCODRAFT_02327474 [Schizophyllum commune H4-8]